MDPPHSQTQRRFPQTQLPDRRLRPHPSPHPCFAGDISDERGADSAGGQGEGVGAAAEEQPREGGREGEDVYDRAEEWSGDGGEFLKAVGGRWGGCVQENEGETGG